MIQAYDQALRFCPTCSGVAERVTVDPDSGLTREQFEAVKAGDWYCDTCRLYWWEDLFSHQLRPSNGTSRYAQRGRPGVDDVGEGASTELHQWADDGGPG